MRNALVLKLVLLEGVINTPRLCQRRIVPVSESMIARTLSTYIITFRWWSCFLATSLTENTDACMPSRTDRWTWMFLVLGKPETWKSWVVQPDNIYSHGLTQETSTKTSVYMMQRHRSYLDIGYSPSGSYFFLSSRVPHEVVVSNILAGNFERDYQHMGIVMYLW